MLIAFHARISSAQSAHDFACVSRAAHSAASPLSKILSRSLQFTFISLTGLPLLRCAADPAIAAGFSWPETACSWRPFSKSRAFPRSPRDETLRPHTTERHRAGGASTKIPRDQVPYAMRDVRLEHAALDAAARLRLPARLPLPSCVAGCAARHSTC